jgi:hypothetical protein
LHKKREALIEKLEISFFWNAGKQERRLIEL